MNFEFECARLSGLSGNASRFRIFILAPTNDNDNTGALTQCDIALTLPLASSALLQCVSAQYTYTLTSVTN
jgi:hypothetical protein